MDGINIEDYDVVGLWWRLRRIYQETNGWMLDNGCLMRIEIDAFLFGARPAKEDLVALSDTRKRLLCNLRDDFGLLFQNNVVMNDSFPTIIEKFIFDYTIGMGAE